MSVSRQILADQHVTEPGFQARPTDVQNPTPVSLSADERDTKKERGHLDLGQVIRKGLELRTRSHTANYQTTGEMAPGDLGSYVIRAGSSSLSISLGKPPAVPEEQRTPLGKARERTWTVEVAIYYAAPCELTWPSNVIFGPFGYRIEESEGLSSIVEVPGPAQNPRPILTTDFYRLTYIERTGQWIAEAVALGVTGADPVSEDPDSTEEPPVEDPWEPGDGLVPDMVYKDPDGNDMSPEDPSWKNGALLAFHDGSISRTINGGADWSRRSGTPRSPSSVSFVPGRGLMLVSEGKAYYSSNAEQWTEVSLSEEVVAEAAFKNGNFETGDLTGWTTTAGDSPRVLDTNSPPQQPGSDYYLARDWRIFTDAAFELSQSVSVPAALNLPEARVSVDVYAEPHAQAELRIGNEPLPTAFDNFSIPSASFFHLPGSHRTIPNVVDDKKARLTFTGAEQSDFRVGWESDNQIILWASDVGGLRSFKFKLEVFEADGTTPAQVTRTFGLKNFLATEGARIIDTSGGTAEILCLEATNELSYNGGTYVSPEAGTADLFVKMNGASSVEFEVLRGCYVSAHKDLDFSITKNVPEGLETGVVIKDEQKNVWHTISATVPVVPGEPIDISLAASGSPADAYFDNVQVVFESVKSNSIELVAAAQNRHLIFTNSGVHEMADGLQRLGDIPFAPQYAAGGGTQIVIAASHDIACSEDNGATFAQFNHQHAFVQVIARGSYIVAVDDNGGVFSVLPSGISPLSSLEPGSRIAWDGKRSLWFGVTPSGSTFKSSMLQTWELQGTQPTNAEATDRRIICTDFGRHFGYTDGLRDIYYSDKPMDQGAQGQAEWKLSKPLMLVFSHMIEVQ